jgi:parvulin-like peptidyl-prolyl isomerase
MANANRRTILSIVLILTLAAALLSCSTRSPTPTPGEMPSDTPADAATLSVTPTLRPQQTVATGTRAPAGTPVQATPVIAGAALVNGQAILLHEFEEQVSQAVAVLGEQQDFDPNTEEGQAALVQLRHQILDSMIDQLLIEQAAARDGITISEQQLEEQIAHLVGENVAQFDEWLRANGLTREKFKVQLGRQMLSAAVQEHVVGSDAPVVEQVHARHILLSSEQEAMDILLKLRAGEDFGALAKQYSQDPGSSETEGDLGFFPRGVMPTSLEAVAFGLAQGQTSGIVKTDFGHHIIEIVEKDPAREVPAEMLPTWRQNTFLQWLQAHRSVAKIKYLIPME